MSEETLLAMIREEISRASEKEQELAERILRLEKALTVQLKAARTSFEWWDNARDKND